jgi:hypothetical protein
MRLSFFTFTFLSFLYFLSFTHALHLPNGFFGMIGPHTKTASSLYELFTSNGIIQGVFIQDSFLTPVFHVIETEKVCSEKNKSKKKKKEDKSKKEEKEKLSLLGMLLSQSGIFPHMGTANTAVLSVHDRDYALFERDLPYEVRIDCVAKTVSTVGKVRVPHVHALAHSWHDTLVRSHTYSLLHQTVTFLDLDASFRVLRKATFRTRYVPLAHSHLRVRDHYVFTDSPLFFSWKHCFQGKFPFILEPQPTYIHVTPDVYTSPETFFIFHYASLVETPDAFILLAPLYETLDFSTVTLYGKYRRLVLHKGNKTITMEKNHALETYNLDFPVHWKDYILLRNLDLSTQTINGFILCDGLTIMKEFWLELSILGEPFIENDSILCFAYNQTGTYFVHLSILNGTQQEYEVDLPGTLGFHSFFKR